jgi:hypothetical protein
VITCTASGYADPAYARAQTHLGTPVQLPASGVTLLRRPAPVGHDLSAPYPLLRCERWRELAEDLSRVDDALCAVAVTDPFSDPGPATLQAAFPDLVRPWKHHHVVTLDGDGPRVSSHHRRNLRKATVTVTRVHAPDAAGPLVELYACLAQRHRITGPAAFPPASLAAQLQVHGARAWLAHHDGAEVGIVVAYVDGRHAWYHLGAASPAGYAAGAMYALFDRMLRDLADEGAAAVDLGAGAGTGTPSAGLERFKRGWADHSLPTHLVGRVIDRSGYRRACERTGTSASGWFPAYREP